MMKFNTRFKPARTAGLSSNLPSLVQSQFKDAQDIGCMMRRALTGDKSVFRSPRYLNALGSPDSFKDANDRLAVARSTWEDLPDKIKSTYGSPERLLADFDKQMEEHKKKLSHPLKRTESSTDSACTSSDLTSTSAGDTKETSTTTKE